MAEMMHRRTMGCAGAGETVRPKCVFAPAVPQSANVRTKVFGRDAPVDRSKCPVATTAAASKLGQQVPRRTAGPCAALPAAAVATIVAAESSLTVQCKVVVPYRPTQHGQQLVLVGGCEALGNWDVKKGVRFTWCEGHSHVADVELPIHSAVACKLVVLGDNNLSTWEPEANRELLLAPTSLASRAAGYTVLCHWGFPECTQVVANALRRGNVARTSSPTVGGGARTGGVNGHPLIAGVKRALAQAGSKVLPGVASWEEEESAAEEEEEEVTPVQTQITVLVPKTGPKLKPEQSLVLVGASQALGRWDPANGLPLERVGEEGSPIWAAHAELPLGEGLQAKVVVVDAVSGKAQTWEPCENRSLASHHRGPKPVMVTAYWGVPETHSLEVDRLPSQAAATAGNPQVVQLLREQLAATSTQLDGLRRERDDARRAMAASEEHMRSLESEVKSMDKAGSRFEMVQLAEQLQTTRKLYETTKREATELGGTVGVTRQLCEAAKREMIGLAHQLEAARRAYEALAPEVEKMERKLASTTRAMEATKPELVALEAQLERARGLFDRTLQKIEMAKTLSSSGEFDSQVVRRRTENRLREFQFAKF